MSAGAPGAPGVEWSDDWVRIIRQKIEALWDRPNKFTRGLYNINTGKSDFNKFVFDPDLKTVTPPYDRCVSKEKCDHMFRWDLSFVFLVSQYCQDNNYSGIWKQDWSFLQSW